MNQDRLGEKEKDPEMERQDESEKQRQRTDIVREGRGTGKRDTGKGRYLGRD